MESAIFLGDLRHRRFAPVRHEFTYPLFMAFLDVDKLPELMRISPFSSYNRWNWAAYHQRDHFGDPGQPLRRRLEVDAARHGILLPRGQIFLLTHLRYLGYNFNPVSFFYFYDEEERLQMVMAEVNNTFAETQNYWLSQAEELEPMTARTSSVKKYRFRKTFHVSPFLKMGHSYDWTFTSPGDDLVVQSNSAEDGVSIFDSTLKLSRRPWEKTQLHSALLRFPWLTAKVTAAIHWQAIRLKLKGVPVVPHPGGGHFQAAGKKHLGASWKTN